MPTTRTFTPAELAAYQVPPDSPQDVQGSETLLADEHVQTLKYSQQRRAVFLADDGLTYSVLYEAPVDAGNYETGPGPHAHGWDGDTVTATRVVSVPVVTQRWRVHEPAVHDAAGQSAFQELTEVYEDAGCRTSAARQWAADLLTKHARELAAQQRAHLLSEGYGFDCACDGCSACLARDFIDLIDPAANAATEYIRPPRQDADAARPFRDLDAAQVHYTDNRARRMAEAYWRLATGKTRTDWLVLGKDHPDARIREGRDWLRAAVAAGLLPLIDPSTGMAITTVSLDLNPRHHA
ncbi:hypothetical protein [Streptomyces sp. H27-H5]|uniref:hypothetical protein n=1 Tax=Streptomyces sp. H27-H5 TaxID=2996460 RepID=UPI00226F4734|nr:hypothetical protein [Streptomyces sp. H27-H5]MCY0957675.1 hypothetical protein [Streptomyces sp. H27-H5]